MPRPGSKYTLKGTRASDTIVVGDQGATVNGNFKAIDPAILSAGIAINGGDGDDSIYGGAGADDLIGGAGNDTLYDSIRDSIFDGGRGIDTVDFRSSTTGVGVDLGGTLYPDVVVADAGGYLGVTLGNATARSGAIKDVENVWGSAGNDFIRGNRAENELHGWDGDDLITALTSGDIAVDKIFGDAGNDELWGGSGNDELTGGVGLDAFVFMPGDADGDWVIHDWNKDEDQAYLLGFTGAVSWSTVIYNGLTSVMASFANGDSITFAGIQNLADVSLVQTNSWPAG